LVRINFGGGLIEGGLVAFFADSLVLLAFGSVSFVAVGSSSFFVDSSPELSVVFFSVAGSFAVG
jgi:hypothetical protein